MSGSNKYTFRITSVDGEHIEEFDDLSSFEESWTDGRPQDYSFDSYVTSDGLSVIYPNDNFTAKALEKRLNGYKAVEARPYLSFQKRILDAIGISAEAVNNLRLSGDPSNTVKTDMGTLHIVENVRDQSDFINKKLTHKKGTGLPIGTKGLIICADEMTDTAIIIDVENRDMSVSELLGGDLVVGTQFDIAQGPENITNIHFGPEDITTFHLLGCPDLVNNMGPRLHSLSQEDNSILVEASGRINTKEFPMYVVGETINKLSLLGIAKEMVDKENGDRVVAISPNERAAELLGCEGEGVYFSVGGRVEKVQEGSVLVVDLHSKKVSIVQESDMAAFRDYGDLDKDLEPF